MQLQEYINAIGFLNWYRWERDFIRISMKEIDVFNGGVNVVKKIASTICIITMVFSFIVCDSRYVYGEEINVSEKDILIKVAEQWIDTCNTVENTCVANSLDSILQVSVSGIENEILEGLGASETIKPTVSLGVNEAITLMKNEDSRTAANDVLVTLEKEVTNTALSQLKNILDVAEINSVGNTVFDLAKENVTLIIGASYCKIGKSYFELALESTDVSDMEYYVALGAKYASIGCSIAIKDVDTIIKNPRMTGKDILGKLISTGFDGLSFYIPGINYALGTAKITIEVTFSLSAIQDKLNLLEQYILHEATASLDIGKYLTAVANQYGPYQVSFNNYEITLEKYLGYCISQENYKIVNVPDKYLLCPVKKIGSYFADSVDIVSITIPQSITSFGEKAIYNCSKLEEVNYNASNAAHSSTTIYNDNGIISKCGTGFKLNIGNTVETIPAGLCMNCGIEEIIIPDNVTQIGKMAFYDSTKLKRIIIGKGVQKIGELAFTGSECLEEVNYNASNAAHSNTTVYNDNGIISKCGTEFKLNIGNTVETIPAGLCMNCGIEEIIIPDNVTQIGKMAFYGCKRLTIKSSREAYAKQYAESNGFIWMLLNGGTVDESEHIHDYEAEMTKEATCTINGTMTYTCSCGHTYAEDIEAVGHTGGNANCHSKAICINCKQPYGELSLSNHDGDIEVRNMQIATCVVAGYTGDTYCKACNKKIIDGEIVQATGEHSYRTIKEKATINKNGSITKKCSVCDTVKSATQIYYPKTITLSKTSFSYDGKAKKPEVTVKGSNGKKISKSNYTVSYKKNTKCGLATVIIKFKGDYKGTLTKNFKITPKGTQLKSVSAASKGFNVKWKKQSQYITGYEIQYSTNKKFTKSTTKIQSVNKASKTSQKIMKLKAKKKYYVRIRTYKQVTINGKKQRVYSSWSKEKTVITRK